MTNFLAENFPGLLPIKVNGEKQMNARQWGFLLQSLGMHWAKTFLFFPKKPLNTGNSDFSGIELTDINSKQTFVVSSQSKSALIGVPVFCDLIITSANDATRKLNIINPQITITQTRNITRTTVQGKNGTVKEFISDGDYDIEINGALFTSDGTYPEDDVKMLIELLKEPNELNVDSVLLQMFDIHSAVVTNYKLSQTIMNDMQLFSVTMVSDEPYEIKNANTI
ncbi:MAG: DUF6046 domain-containing protein [Bacteroidales bacterium]